MSRRPASLALWGALAAALGVSGYLLMSTTFMPYDDEGFVLISLRNYLAGLRLYDDVFSQYGPWPYVYHQLLTTAAGHAPLTHTLGRAITLFHWVAMALLSGRLAWQLARSQAAAAAAAILVFTLSWQTTSEPSHPGSHIGFLVALAAVTAAALPGARRPAAAGALLGAITGLLLLTKINVGLLLAAGTGYFALRHTAWPARWRWLGWPGLAGLLTLPWVLLGRQLDHPWALAFALQFTLAAAGLAWVTPADAAARPLAPRTWLAAAVAALATVLVLCAWVLARGTTPRALVEAVLLNPLRMPARFMVGITWYPGAWVLAVTGGAIAARAGWESRRTGKLADATARVVLGFRAGVVLLFVWYAREWPSYFGIFHFAAFCLPLLPAFLVPLARGRSESQGLAFTAAACVALPQVLHAFPVAGSQLAWATFLGVPLFVAGWWEAAAAAPGLVPRAGTRLARAGSFLLVAASVLSLGLVARTGWQRYRESRPLDLPGAEGLRLDGHTRGALRLLSLNAGIHADLLFSRQGMYSHNLWSGVPTPTAQNATHWFWLLTDPQQRAIIGRLTATPRTALITSHSIDDFLVAFKVPVEGPLQDFVQQHYQPLFAYRDFTFSVPRGSAAVPFGRYEKWDATARDGSVPPTLLRTNVALEGVPARIQFEEMEYPWATGPEVLAGAVSAVVEPIDRDGRPAGAPITLPSARSLRGLYRLSLYTSQVPSGLALGDYALVVRDAEGQVLSESVF